MLTVREAQAVKLTVHLAGDHDGHLNVSVELGSALHVHHLWPKSGHGYYRSEHTKNQITISQSDVAEFKRAQEWRAISWRLAYNLIMDNVEAFEFAAGLREGFRDALQRWSDANAVRRTTRRLLAPAEPEEITKLRKRWSKEQALLWNHARPRSKRQLKRSKRRLMILEQRLRALAPMWCPPTERDVEAATKPISKILEAVESGITALEKMETVSGQRPWYLDTVEFAGIEPKLNEYVGLGMSMRAPKSEDDPKLRLLICRDLLKSYLEQTQKKWLPTSTDGKPYRRALYESVIVTLRRARVHAHLIGHLLRTRGYTANETTYTSINGTVKKLKQRHGIPLPALPRGRRRSR